jgi:uncharacterized membrane-anchored protein YhcB (DUF1043 family)
MEMQQMLEMLLANQAAQARMEAKMDSNRAKLDAYHKEMMAKLEAKTAAI